MKNKYLLLSVVLAVVAMILIWTVPAMAADKTPFTCTETFLELIDPGQEFVSNSNTHIRGTILTFKEESEDDPRVAGTNIVVLNANVRADGTGRMWGTFRIESGENEGSGWEGTYAGRFAENWYNAVGDGFGEYSGLKMWWNMRPDGCSGSILEQ